MKTASEYRAEASASLKRSQDSFDRCDTDGFLSQWANDITSRLDHAKADILDDGKRAVFRGLYDGDRRVKAKDIETRYGRAWLLDDAEADRYGRKFIPTGDNSRIQKNLGLAERQEWAPAWAALQGNGGTGLSGCASVRVVVFRTGDKWGSDAELL